MNHDKCDSCPVQPVCRKGPAKRATNTGKNDPVAMQDDVKAEDMTQDKPEAKP